MSISHKFTISTAAAKELYEHNYSKYLCNIHNLCYPFEETDEGVTHLWAINTPNQLCGFLIEDGVDFSYESYDIEENNKLLRLEEENRVLCKKHDALMLDNDALRARLSELKAKYTKRGDEIENLKYHIRTLVS
jgi:hypothetical protein